MAILSKIRDRSMFLILIVGLALFAFVLDPRAIQNFFSSTKINEIGQINGTNVDREEFVRQVDNYKTRSGQKVTQMQAVNAVWNNMVSEKIFETQLSKAGIVVGEKDIWDAMISLPEIQNSPIFKNDAKLFDEEKLKEYVANLKSDAENGNKEGWLNWLQTEKTIKQELERRAYTSLVTAGLEASLSEGEDAYQFANDKIDGEYVFLPYTSVPDTEIKVSKEEILKFVKENSEKYKIEPSRSIQYVKIPIIPSADDDATVKKEVGSYINDREEYSNAAKATVKVPGLKNATNYEEFLNENKSDLSLDNNIYYKNQLPVSVADSLINAAVGTVVGPYKDKGYYKLSKVVEVLQLPDSVKSSHIIIPYLGSARSTTTKTREEAKKMADSIFAIVKNNKEKFKEIANTVNTDGTKGKGGEIGWVSKDQAFSASFDKDFANYIFKNSKGGVKIVETTFGFHIIRIDDQTKSQKAIKLVTFGRIIEPSELTENKIFQEAETFAAKLADSKNISKLATEDNYKVVSAVNIKPLDENIIGLFNQRQIVTWAFKDEQNVGDSKRFDIDDTGNRSYIIAEITEKIEKDGNSINSAMAAQVRDEIVKLKKEQILVEKLKGTSLEAIAKNNNIEVNKVSLVTLANPTLAGSGTEPAVVGAMSAIKLNTVSSPIAGNKGVFVVQVTKNERGAKLDNYESFSTQLTSKLHARTYQLYQVLIDNADIVDNRFHFF